MISLDQDDVDLTFATDMWAIAAERADGLEQKIALCGLRWFKLNVSKYQKRCQVVKKMSSCQKDVKCQKMKHLDYGGGSQKN